MSRIIFPSVYPVTGHTDFVGQGSTFVAIAGAKQNGLNFIPLALEKGATKIVIKVGEIISPELYNLITDYNATLEFVDDTRKALAELSARALDFPAKKLKIVGITGTKGKTSSAYMAYHMLHTIGKKVALVSTIEKKIGAELISIPLTTPLPDQLQMFLSVCVNEGIEFVVLEVSAQALTLNRVDGINFEAGVFTNFSHEHLEFYKDLSEYFAAKTLLVDTIKSSKNMFINIDDQYGYQLFLNNPNCSTFSFQNKQATLYGCTHQADGQMMLHVKNKGQMHDIYIPFLGIFNAYNLLGVLGLMDTLAIDFSLLKYALKNLPHVPGRMEKYPLKNEATCFIDYAHNPSSFEAVLSTLRSMTSHLIVVFGAGGNRDPQKRPLMGQIAQKYCDIVIVTSDNPRDESPLDIAIAIQKGFDFTNQFEFYQELNRVKAIELGYELSKKGSILAILGKGRDEYQIVGGLTFPFKERSIIKPFMIENEITSEQIIQFQQKIYEYYLKNKRNFSWRENINPYNVFISEVMLQQTQTSRVIFKFQQWLEKFPDFKSLAQASGYEVLASWQGLGYNSRGLRLLHAAQIIEDKFKGVLPDILEDLKNLPGIGPNTAGSISAFAFNKPVVFIETNIRTVFLYEFFKDKELVCDKEILNLVAQTVDSNNPRDWYYALMDYGVYLEKELKINNKKSKQYNRQSKFIGSRRQVRGAIIRVLSKMKKLSEEDLFCLLEQELPGNTHSFENILKELIEEKLVYTKNQNLFL